SLEHLHSEEALLDRPEFEDRLHAPSSFVRVASSTAANRITPPLTIMIVKCDRFRRFRLLSIKVRKRTPNTVQITFPFPPYKLVPPITVAPITSSRLFRQCTGEPVSKRPVISTAAIPAQIPHS